MIRDDRPMMIMSFVNKYSGVHQGKYKIEGKYHVLNKNTVCFIFNLIRDSRSLSRVSFLQCKIEGKYHVLRVSQVDHITY